jgi:hypothetical protein
MVMDDGGGIRTTYICFTYIVLSFNRDPHNLRVCTVSELTLFCCTLAETCNIYKCIVVTVHEGELHTYNITLKYIIFSLHVLVFLNFTVSYIHIARPLY